MTVEPIVPNSLPDLGGGDAAAPLSEPAEIDDLLSLHKAMRKLQTVRSRLAEVELTARREHEAIDEWEQTATKDDLREKAYLEAQIGSYALRRRSETNGHDKTITGPHGRVETRELPTEYVKDESALFPFAESHGFVRERVIREVDWAALKKRVIPHMAGTVLLDGEEVPGLTHRLREPSVEVVTWD